MSRKQRVLKKRYAIFCEGDTEYNYTDKMRKKQGVELFIIVGWTVLELCFVGTLYRYGAIGRGNPATYITGIIIVTVVSMVCYMLYYDLEYVKGYIDGMIPLILTGIMMVIINLGVRK